MARDYGRPCMKIIAFPCLAPIPLHRHSCCHQPALSGTTGESRPPPRACCNCRRARGDGLLFPFISWERCLEERPARRTNWFWDRSSWSCTLRRRWHSGRPAWRFPAAWHPVCLLIRLAGHVFALLLRQEPRPRPTPPPGRPQKGARPGDGAADAIRPCGPRLG